MDIYPKINENEKLELKEDNAINHPEEIARLLVSKGIPITLLNVMEEDLESYFLRTIGIKGGAT
jgi:ABC-2 type transport system ATP-binding protein